METPQFLEPILAAPRWQKLLLGGMGLVLIVGAVYYLLIAPAVARIQTLEARQASVQRELAEARRNLAEMQRFQREIAELERRIDLVKEKLPTDKEMPGLFRTVSDAAHQTGLAVALFQPRDPKANEFYSEVPIVVNAEGGFHQVGEFMERLSVIPRVVNVTDWKLSGLSKGPRSVKADLTLATYMYRPVGSPPVPKPGARPAPPQPPRPR